MCLYGIRPVQVGPYTIILCIPIRYMNREPFKERGDLLRRLCAGCDKHQKDTIACFKCRTERTQYPLIKEYTLNHIRDPTIILRHIP